MDNALKIFRKNILSNRLFYTRFLTMEIGKDVITIEEVRTLKDDSKVFFVDVREPEEIKNTGLIPGSVNIPLDNHRRVRHVEMFLSSFIFLVIVSTAVAQGKSGNCPNNLQLSVCSTTCYSDWECGGPAKCCRTVCGGTICVSPVVESQQDAGKFGRCPSSPTGPWVCSSRCSTDSDCRGKKKCCRNRCGAMACFNPELPALY